MSAKETAQEVQMTLDIRPDVEHLEVLKNFSNCPIAQDSSVAIATRLAARAVLNVICARAAKQAEMLESVRFAGGPLSNVLKPEA